jgi:hypothetical protein
MDDKTFFALPMKDAIDLQIGDVIVRERTSQRVEGIRIVERTKILRDSELEVTTDCGAYRFFGFTDIRIMERKK